MYARVCTQGTNSFEGVIHPHSFEGAFQIDTVEGVHACACMCTVHIFKSQPLFLQYFLMFAICFLNRYYVPFPHINII